jgi:hypothetical protein
MEDPAFRFDRLLDEVIKRQRDEGATERRLTDAKDNNSIIPNDISGRRVEDLSAELALRRASRDSLRAQLAPVLRTVLR